MNSFQNRNGMLEWICSKMEWIHSNIISQIIISVHNFLVIKDREVIPLEINSHYYSWIFPQGLHIKFQKTLVRIHSILVQIHSILVRIHSILVRIRSKWVPSSTEMWYSSECSCGKKTTGPAPRILGGSDASVSEDTNIKRENINLYFFRKMNIRGWSLW